MKTIEIINVDPNLPEDEYVAINLGRDDGFEAVNETLAADGCEAVLESLRLSRERDYSHWEEAASAASVHTMHRDAEWNEVSRRLYYEAYATASIVRAEEIEAEI